MGTITAKASAGKPGKISLGNIATKKDDTKTAYPVLDTAPARELAARIIKRTAEFEAIKGALETDKAELKAVYAAPRYFEVNHGKHDVPSSISVPSDNGEVLVSFANRYSKLESDAPVRQLIGDEFTDQFFHQSFEIKISGDKLPADTAQDLIGELQALFLKHNALDALEAKEGIKPTTEFHAARHVVLTPAQNMALEQVCPIISMVKTKGRK